MPVTPYDAHLHNMQQRRQKDERPQICARSISKFTGQIPKTLLKTGK
jgi:hypothetical protein